MSLADFIDNTPMAKLFTAVIHEGPGMLGRAMGKVLDGAAAVHDSVTAGVSGIMGGIKDLVPSMSLGAEKAEHSVAPVRTPGITAPAQAHHVDMADIGSFSAPTFGSGPVSQGVQR